MAPPTPIRYLLVLADTLLQWIHLLAYEDFTIYKEKDDDKYSFVDNLSRLERDLSFLHQQHQHQLRTEDYQSLLNSLVDPLKETMEVALKMWRLALEKRYIFPDNKVLIFIDCFPNEPSSLLDSFRIITERVHEIVIKIRDGDDSFFGELQEESIEVIIGRENDKAKIIKLIQQAEENNVRVIPVFGVPGIGKTTLARIIYQDNQIIRGGMFDLRLWVVMGDVSYCDKTKVVVTRLLQSAGVQVSDNLPMDSLMNKLGEVIKGKRCFIVMDDMVRENHLTRTNLEAMLKGCAKGTCVLITTRSEKLANVMVESSVQSYCLGALNGEDSWVLFERRAFVTDQELVEKGRKIVAKCEGVPLSLLVISTFILLADVLRPRWRWFESNFAEEVSKYKGVMFAENTQEKRADSSISEDVILGRDEDKEAIITKLLLEEVENPLVISIVGVGGLGKTALAQHIFNDERVKSHFDLKIWVSVTEFCDAKQIMEKIILSINSNWPEYNNRTEEMERFFRQEIQGKRFLLILDNAEIHLRHGWEQLFQFLSYGEDGSSVILTTRDEKVGEISVEKKNKCELKGLDEDSSWKLFLKVAFVQGEEEHSIDAEIIKIGKQIVSKCRGVPLVITTVGTLLFSMNPKTEWQSFYDEKLVKVLESDVLETLRLSYDHLSPQLRICFAYCALFPKDYEIDVETLVFLWMCHEFLELEGAWEGEEAKVGYEYFRSLLRRSFFKATKEDEFSGKITKCKMQNSMHDLARIVAEKNVYATIRLRLREEDNKCDGSLLRHVCFDFHLDSSWQIPSSLAKSKQIRSLILPRQYRLAIEGRSSESICDVILKFKWLQMLDLHNTGIKILPNSLGELKQLCYLDLSQNVNIKSLPSSIGKLKNLHTLKLNHCSNLRTLPSEVTKLVKLRNLENESCYSLTRMPQGLHQLLQLRRLPEFVLNKGIGSVSKKSGNLSELSHLNKLKGKLKIKNLRFSKDDKTAEANLIEKEDLKSLGLIWDINVSDNQADCEKALEDLKPYRNLDELSISGYGGSKFSTWLPYLSGLVKLSLSRCNSCVLLPPLNRLYNLEVLVVDEMMKLEYILVETLDSDDYVSSPWFGSLKELRLTNLPELKGWFNDAKVCEEIKFPCLSKLVIEDCPNLNSMPLFPTVDELLVLKNTSWRPLKQTGRLEVGIRTSSSAYPPLSGLRTVQIIDMFDSLCAMWDSLPFVSSVTLDHVDRINDHLEVLQKVTSLQQLNIWRCDDLEEIPSWITDSSSLKAVSIKLCPNLRIPREKISLITSLNKVEIEDCPQVYHLETMLKDPLYNR